MQVGVKIWRVEKNLDELIEKAKPDFIETMAITTEDYRLLKNCGLPITIHAEHTHFGVNQADSQLAEKNRKSLEYAIKTADMLGSDIIVLHPGIIMNKNCSMQSTIDFIIGFSDPRIRVENMPIYKSAEGKYINVGKSIEEMTRILNETKMGFCLDIDHAAVAAINSGLDYMQALKRFMALKPDYFHISDTTLESKQGDHLHIGEGELDIEVIKKLLPSDARVALETPVDIEGRAKDVELMRK